MSMREESSMSDLELVNELEDIIFDRMQMEIRAETLRPLPELVQRFIARSAALAVAERVEGLREAAAFYRSAALSGEKISEGVDARFRVRLK